MFLYVYADGRVGQSSIGPLHHDIQAIQKGELRVFYMWVGMDGRFFREWATEPANVDIPLYSPDATNNFHAPVD